MYFILFLKPTSYCAGFPSNTSTLGCQGTAPRFFSVSWLTVLGTLLCEVCGRQCDISWHDIQVARCLRCPCLQAHGLPLSVKDDLRVGELWSKRGIVEFVNTFRIFRASWVVEIVFFKNMYHNAFVQGWFTPQNRALAFSSSVSFDHDLIFPWKRRAKPTPVLDPNPSHTDRYIDVWLLRIIQSPEAVCKLLQLGELIYWYFKNVCCLSALAENPAVSICIISKVYSFFLFIMGNIAH